MVSQPTIPGYCYGSAEQSPISLTELHDLERAVGLTAADSDALIRLLALIEPRMDELFGAWMGRIGHFFAPAFNGPDGRPDDRYMQAAHPRFIQWIRDTCTPPHDQQWLDYQHEIAVRHTREKKNRTDDVVSTEVVPFRYLIAAAAPMTEALRDFVPEAERVELIDAWLKSLLLQVALWSRAYVPAEDW